MQRALWGALLGVFMGSCQVAPPRAAFQGPEGLIRADLAHEAEEVSGYFEELRTSVDALLPGTDNRAREVWVQEEPAMYTFSGSAYAEADGFWSESAGRIHLRRNSQSLRRTLAHELVHASLQGPWRALPGTIEEGLCDVVSVMLCPADATQMRTGRLSAAAFATGGLELEVELFMTQMNGGSGLRIGRKTHMRLQANVASQAQPNDVFSVRAGLSTTDVSVADKKALYGLSFLLVERIVQRVGIVGLYGLCLRASSMGLDEVPASWLLNAADLEGATIADWRDALRRAFGPEELEVLVQLYPSLLTGSATRFFGGRTQVQLSEGGPSAIAASIRVTGGQTMLDLGLQMSQQSHPVEAQFVRQ